MRANGNTCNEIGLFFIIIINHPHPHYNSTALFSSSFRTCLTEDGGGGGGGGINESVSEAGREDGGGGDLDDKDIGREGGGGGEVEDKDIESGREVEG